MYAPPMFPGYVDQPYFPTTFSSPSAPTDYSMLSGPGEITAPWSPSSPSAPYEPSASSMPTGPWGSENSATQTLSASGPDWFAFSGPTGPSSCTSPSGPTGFDGQSGPTNSTFYGDASGLTGPGGVSGMSGPTGDSDASGSTGNSGASGPTADSGASGPTDDSDAAGPTDNSGPTGPGSDDANSAPTTPVIPSTADGPKMPYTVTLKSRTDAIRELQRKPTDADVGYFVVSLDRPIAAGDAAITLTLTFDEFVESPARLSDRDFTYEGDLTVIFNPGSDNTTREIKITAVNDREVEPTENIGLRIVRNYTDTWLTGQENVSMKLYDNDYWTLEDAGRHERSSGTAGKFLKTGTDSYSYDLKTTGVIFPHDYALFKARTKIEVRDKDYYYSDAHLSKDVDVRMDSKTGKITVFASPTWGSPNDRDAGTAIGFTYSITNIDNNGQEATIDFSLLAGVRYKYSVKNSFSVGGQVGGAFGAPADQPEKAPYQWEVGATVGNEIVREQMAGKEFSGGGAYKVRSVVMDKADE